MSVTDFDVKNLRFCWNGLQVDSKFIAGQYIEDYDSDFRTWRVRFIPDDPNALGFTQLCFEKDSLMLYAMRAFYESKLNIVGSKINQINLEMVKHQQAGNSEYVYDLHNAQNALLSEQQMYQQQYSSISCPIKPSKEEIQIYFRNLAVEKAANTERAKIWLEERSKNMLAKDQHIADFKAKLAEAMKTYPIKDDTAYILFDWKIDGESIVDLPKKCSVKAEECISRYMYSAKLRGWSTLNLYQYIADIRVFKTSKDAEPIFSCEQVYRLYDRYRRGETEVSPLKIKILDLANTYRKNFETNPMQVLTGIELDSLYAASPSLPK